MPEPGILEIEQPGALRARARLKAHQVGREVVPMHKTLRASEGREHGAQRCIKPSAQLIAGRAAHHRGPPPIKKRRRRRPRHGRRIPGRQVGWWRCFMQRCKRFCRFGVKHRRIRPAIQQSRMGRFAEIFQQHQAGFGIGGDDLGRGKP